LGLFHAKASSGATRVDIDSGAASNEALLRYRDNGTEYWAAGKASNNDFMIWDSNNTVDRFHIKESDGNVGIGTTVPGQKLEVNGIVKQTGSQTTYQQDPSSFPATIAWENFGLPAGAGVYPVYITGRDSGGGRARVKKYLISFNGSGLIGISSVLEDFDALTSGLDFSCSISGGDLEVADGGLMDRVYISPVFLRIGGVY